MAVAWFRNPVLDHHAPIIERDSVNENTFGRTTTYRHPKYVYAINGNACLMHKILQVEIHWYAYVGMHKLGRLKQPAMVATTVCGYGRPLTPERSRTCTVPLPGAILCGRCHGEPASFGKHGAATKARIQKKVAHVKLGCVVNGYPSSPGNRQVGR